jgi:ABC-2 type transport system permease protein
MKNFLKNELNDYLSGRSAELKKEKPLELSENQGYSHYNKGSLMHYTIQDYMGEKHLNHGLATFLEKCKVGLIQLIPRLKQQY